MWGFSQFLQIICEAPVVAGSGLYASREVEPTSAEMLAAWIHDNNIPNPISTTNMHVTVVHTKSDLPNWQPDRRVLTVKPSTYSIDKFGDVLVLRFRSQELAMQNQKARALGAVMTYPEYHPHITLSYKVPPTFDWTSLRPPPIYIELDPERNEALDDTYVAKMKLGEVAPPSKKIKHWLSSPDVKRSFQKQYGDKWRNVMFATAWRRHQAS